MNKLIKYTASIGIALLACLMHACSDDTFVQQDATSKEGVPLNMSVSFGTSVQTRLAELPNSDAMNEAIGKDDKLKHVGLYIYYSDDYNKSPGGDLTKPYIRNLECKVKEGRLIPVTGEEIYIYDRMTVVAFYPYNAEMSNSKNFFKVKNDEEAYPISESTYANQHYIPYRAELETNPTIAYLAKLSFAPKHTAKIEIVLVADKEESFPKEGIKITPGIDPVLPETNSGTGYSADNREKWLDGTNFYPVDNEGQVRTPIGGKYARQYVAYIWTSKAGNDHHDNGGVDVTTNDRNHSDNIIQVGDIIFQSNQLTLLASQTVNLAERRVYRYGYNLDNGEVFIPTSSKLVCDAQSLQTNAANAYQVCDIDLKSITTWQPITLANASYDGGGHQITGLLIDDDVTAKNNKSKQQFGLFGKISGNSCLRNINLIAPHITVIGSTTATADTCYVGALCGQVNPSLNPEEKNTLLNDGLPAGLSEVVKAALREEMLSAFFNSTSQIIACRVENPTITVTGNAPRVGSVCGAAGDKDMEGSYQASIWDSYSLGGTITVTGAAVATLVAPQTLQVGGFCGFNNGKISRCYTTIEKITATYDKTTGETTTPVTNDFSYFARKGTFFESGKMTNCYAQKVDATTDTAFPISIFGVDSWPDAASWVTYTGRWPVYTNDWEETGSGNHPTKRSFWQKVSPSYPILLWEERM